MTKRRIPTIKLALSAVLLLALVSSTYATITINGNETWDGDEMHGISPTGSGTAGDPYVYVIPDGMTLSNGGIEMNDKYVTFDFSSGTGGLDIAAGGYFDLTGSTRNSDPGECTIILGNHDLTGAGDFKTLDISKDSMDVNIVGSNDVTVDSFYMRVSDARAGLLSIDVAGSVNIGWVDTQDQASGGGDGGDVIIRGADITIGDIDTRSLRISSPTAFSGDVVLEARDYVGPNTLNNTVNAYGDINTNSAIGTDGDVTIRGVVVTLESGFSVTAGDGSLNIHAGIVQYGKTAADLFIDDSGDGYSATHNVPWTNPGAEFYASEPSPNPGAEDVCPVVPLRWTEGLRASSHDVYIGTDFIDVNDANSTYYPNVDYNNVDVNHYTPDPLLPSATYYWRVDEVNEPNLWTGAIWLFTTDKGTAYNPSPTNDTAGVLVDANLSWTPGCVASSHDVYIGTDFNDVNDANNTFYPNVDYNNVDVNTFEPGLLSLGTTYYWRVDQVNDSYPANVWAGTVWRFEVEDGRATDPSPGNRTFWQPVDATLSWTPGALATSHDVYFGTDLDDVNDANSTYHPNVDYDNVDVNDHSPGSLALGTTYYWRIDEVSATICVKGDIWRFATVGILHLKVDLGLPQCADDGAVVILDPPVEGTVKEGWWGFVVLAFTDMYMHDAYWEGGESGDGPPPDTDGIAGSGVHVALGCGGVGNGGFHVYELCRNSQGGDGCPSGSPTGGAIANGWYHNIDWGGEGRGDILMRINGLPAGEYVLVSYHNHWEPCTQATRNCLNCESEMPNMHSVTAQSLPVDPLPRTGYSGWNFTPGTGMGVTPIEDACDVDVTSVTSDDQVSTSTITFHTDGSDVLVIYKGGDNTYPDPARSGREGSKGVLNAFELILKSSPCGLYRDSIVDYLDVSVFGNNWLWLDDPGVINIADFNQDGTVNLHDFAYLAMQWLESCP